MHSFIYMQSKRHKNTSGDYKKKNISGSLSQVLNHQFSSVQSHSCAQLCDTMNCRMPGFPVHHQFLELIQTHVHWVCDAVQPSHPLSSPSPPAFNLSQHQGLFQWLSSSHQVAKLWEFQLQHQCFQRIWKPWLGFLAFQGTLKSLFLPQFKNINSSVLSFLYSPTLTSIHDYWKNIAVTRRTFVGKVMSLLFNMLPRLVTAFLPRSKHLLISWLQSPSGVILEPKKIKSVTVSTVFPSICHEVIGLDSKIFVFWMLSFHHPLSLSSRGSFSLSYFT